MLRSPALTGRTKFLPIRCRKVLTNFVESGDLVAHSVFFDWTSCTAANQEAPGIVGTGPTNVAVRVTLTNTPANGARLYAVLYTVREGDNLFGASVHSTFGVVGDPAEQFVSATPLNTGDSVYFVFKVVFVSGVMTVSPALVYLQ